MRDITRELRVGTCCGKCVPEAKAALDTCLAQHDAAARRNQADSPAYFPGAAAEFAV
jgi:NAD(P)H-nitrite reductase large subunit